MAKKVGTAYYVLLWPSCLDRATGRAAVLHLNATMEPESKSTHRSASLPALSEQKCFVTSPYHVTRLMRSRRFVKRRVSFNTHSSGQLTLAVRKNHVSDWYYSSSLPSACKRHCYPERGTLSSQKYVLSSSYVCTCSYPSSRMGFDKSTPNPQCKCGIQSPLRTEWLRKRRRWNQSPPNRPYRRCPHPHA